MMATSISLRSEAGLSQRDVETLATHFHRQRYRPLISKFISEDLEWSRCLQPSVQQFSVDPGQQRLEASIVQHGKKHAKVGRFTGMKRIDELILVSVERFGLHEIKIDNTLPSDPILKSLPSEFLPDIMPV